MTSRRVGSIDGQVKSRARHRAASWEKIYLENITFVYVDAYTESSPAFSRLYLYLVVALIRRFIILLLSWETT